MYTRVRNRVARGGGEAGFGIVELVAAMAVLAIGVLALFIMFQSGITQIRRAATVTTATALADTEMERFRAVRYSVLGLAQADLDAIPSTEVYKTDPAWKPVSTPPNEVDSTVVLAKCPNASPCTDALPSRTVPGADGKSYRVDTYMTWLAVSNANNVSGRNVKLITIVVREVHNPARVWARVSSSFDEATGI